MRVGIVFHKDPFAEPSGIDLVRLRAIAGGLIRSNVDAEIISPVGREGTIEGGIPVRGLNVLRDPGRYDVVKTSYHDSIALVGSYTGPVVSRIVRVVDRKLPARDDSIRAKLLACQRLIRQRSAALVLNNDENRVRWRTLYGDEPPIWIIPTGCPSVLPPAAPDPYPSSLPPILFLGSIAAPRMVEMLNGAARKLADVATIHLVGRNKACMYGGDPGCTLDPAVVEHGEKAEPDVWPYILHAAMGLALATGPDPFDNDVSKILNYLRGGLPVLSEEPIVNNTLIRKTGLGMIIGYGQVDDLAAAARFMLDHPPDDSSREAAMKFMARQHSWEKRVEAYIELFSSVMISRTR